MDVFFAENGLTSTSANHIANLAKEAYQNLENELNSICFYTTKVSLLGTSTKEVLHYGNQLIDVTKLDKIAELKSLIAWLREAIKAKEQLTRNINKLELRGYCEMMGIEYPKKPVMEASLTESEYYDSLNIKIRNRYYQLETQAAVLGKYIHQNSPYAIAREGLAQRITNPKEVKGSGRDTLIYSYEPVVALNEVDKQFFELQNKYREIQAQLNAMKHECEIAMNESEVKVQTEYSTAFNKYSLEMEELQNKLREYIIAENNRIKALKIVIPDSLKSIYEYVSTLGK